MPLQIDEQTVLKNIAVHKDVDGFSARKLGAVALKGGKPYAISCTPAGIMEMLNRRNIPVYLLQS